MRTFTYWVAACNHDSECYSIIGKTKKEVLTTLKMRSDAHLYDEPVKRHVDYDDIFEFFDLVTGEGGGRNCGYKD